MHIHIYYIYYLLYIYTGDFYMTPEDAKAYGLIDTVIQHKRMIATPKIPSLKVSIYCVCSTV